MILEPVACIAHHNTGPDTRGLVLAIKHPFINFEWKKNTLRCTSQLNAQICQSRIIACPQGGERGWGWGVQEQESMAAQWSVTP